MTMDFIAHLHRQRAFSARTFGPGARTAGVLDHIRKELREIEAKPDDLSEWIDVVLLACDGAWRAGHTPEQIAEALAAKLAHNETREWPDWRTADPDRAIEHVRTPTTHADALAAVESAHPQETCDASEQRMEAQAISEWLMQEAASKREMGEAFGRHALDGVTPDAVVLERAAELIREVNAALVKALREAEAALADIGDAEREEGDDVAWCERRAAEPLPAIRAALAASQKCAGNG